MRAFLSALLLIPTLFSAQPVHSEERIGLDVGHGLVHDALLYRADSTKAAVLAHQSGETMESWRNFAHKLKERGYSSVSLSRSTPDDVVAAVRHLRADGQDEIVLIGASVGGGAILQALAKGEVPGVRKVILLSPSAGPAMTSREIAKMVLVAKADFYNARAYTAFEEAADPKTLSEYEGREHGQELLHGQHKVDVLKVIFDFLELH